MSEYFVDYVRYTIFFRFIRIISSSIGLFRYIVCIRHIHFTRYYICYVGFARLIRVT